MTWPIGYDSSHNVEPPVHSCRLTFNYATKMLVSYTLFHRSIENTELCMPLPYTPVNKSRGNTKPVCCLYIFCL